MQPSQSRSCVCTWVPHLQENAPSLWARYPCTFHRAEPCAPSLLTQRTAHFIQQIQTAPLHQNPTTRGACPRHAKRGRRHSPSRRPQPASLPHAHQAHQAPRRDRSPTPSCPPPPRRCVRRACNGPPVQAPPTEPPGQEAAPPPCPPALGSGAQRTACVRTGSGMGPPRGEPIPDPVFTACRRFTCRWRSAGRGSTGRRGTGCCSCSRCSTRCPGRSGSRTPRSRLVKGSGFRV